MVQVRKINYIDLYIKHMSNVDPSETLEKSFPNESGEKNKLDSFL